MTPCGIAGPIANGGSSFGDKYMKINLQREALPLLRQMADEAGLGLADMVEIAVYNLIGLWQKDRGVGKVPLDSSDGLDGPV